MIFFWNGVIQTSMEYNGRVSHGHITRARSRKRILLWREKRHINLDSHINYLLSTNSTDDLGKINWLVLIFYERQRGWKPNHMQSMNAELSVLINQPAHLFVNMLLLVVQTSPCVEVWFEIWLKAHGKFFKASETHSYIWWTVPLILKLVTNIRCAICFS